LNNTKIIAETIIIVAIIAAGVILIVKGYGFIVLVALIVLAIFY